MNGEAVSHRFKRRRTGKHIRRGEAELPKAGASAVCLTASQNEMIRGYRELIVWQKAMELVKMVYRLMRNFPADERFRLCDQLSRAVISIPSNIAEGNGRESKSEYARFLGIARGSLYETETQLEIAKELGYVDNLSDVLSLTSEIRRMLISIMSKLRS